MKSKSLYVNGLVRHSNNNLIVINMTQKQQLLAVLYVWLALTLTAFAFDLRLVAHFNNGVVLLFCATAIWFFHNDDE